MWLESGGRVKFSPEERALQSEQKNSTKSKNEERAVR